VTSPARPHFHRQEVASTNTFQCAFRNVDHDVRWLRSGDGSMPLRFNIGNRPASYLMIDVGQRSLNARVAPAGILPRHANDRSYFWTGRAASTRRASPMRGASAPVRAPQTGTALNVSEEKGERGCVAVRVHNVLSLLDTAIVERDDLQVEPAFRDPILINTCNFGRVC
jgi:hypothetical protein